MIVKLIIGKQGKIVAIEHIDDAQEDDRLRAFYIDVGLEKG